MIIVRVKNGCVVDVKKKGGPFVQSILVAIRDYDTQESSRKYAETIYEF